MQQEEEGLSQRQRATQRTRRGLPARFACACVRAPFAKHPRTTTQQEEEWRAGKVHLSSGGNEGVHPFAPLRLRRSASACSVQLRAAACAHRRGASRAALAPPAAHLCHHRQPAEHMQRGGGAHVRQRQRARPCVVASTPPAPPPPLCWAEQTSALDHARVQHVWLCLGSHRYAHGAEVSSNHHMLQACSVRAASRA